MSVHFRITSYINNLHPVHDSQLYSMMEEILTATIPLWERTISPIRRYAHRHGVRIPYDEVTYDFNPQYGADAMPQVFPPPEVGEDQYTYADRIHEWLDEARILALPDAGAFAGPPSHPLPYPLSEKFKDQGLQVFIKLTNIQLCPDNPIFYDGDTWHADGQIVSRFCSVLR